MFKGLTKEEKSWILYDLAESPYTITILATIMGMYFITSAEAAIGDEVVASSYWAFGNTIATLSIGIVAPVVGTLSGYKGKKKMLFNLFACLGILGTAALAVVPEHLWLPLLIVYIFSYIGFAGANKVYNAFLVDVSPEDRMHKVSSLGFGLGYLGCVPPFIVCIAFVVLAQFEIIPMQVVTAYRISFIITAIWWIFFSMPMFKNVHQKYGTEVEPQYVRKSFVKVWTTVKDIYNYRHHDMEESLHVEKGTVTIWEWLKDLKNRPILIFLVAFFLYSDGVSSIIGMATVYGMTIGINEVQLLLVLLVTQLVAGPCAIIYGRLADKFGAKNTIYLGIGTYVVICLIALLMSPERDIQFLTMLFWLLAMLVGTAQGGIQALSRSYFSKIIPKEKSNEYFGFYNIFGRLASVIGMTLFGWVSLRTGRPHFGIAVIAVLFILAATIFRYVPDDRTFKVK